MFRPSVLWQRRLRMVESACPSKLFPRHNQGLWASGSSARRPMPHTGSKRAGFVKQLTTSIQKVAFYHRVWLKLGQRPFSRSSSQMM